MNRQPRAAPGSIGAVAVLIVLWLAATAGWRPLMLPDEGRYVGVAWEMMRSGDWLTPTLNGLAFLHKPPLFYWITASSMSLFGLNEWAGRLASVLGASIGAFSLYMFIRCWWDERTARLALLALLAQPLFYVAGQFANLDMLVAGFITATIVLAAHAALCIERGRPFRLALCAAYVAAAAGVLAKGLIGFVIPVLVVATWLLVRRRRRVALALVWWPGIALFALLATPWFVAMQARLPGFLDYFFVVQHLKRFAGSGFNNVRPFWFYPTALVLFGLPWLPWLCKSFSRGYFSDTERGTLRLLLWLWVVLVVLFFSLPRSKLLGYIVPAVAPLAALAADAFVRFGSASRRLRRLWAGGLVLTALLSLGAIAAFALMPPYTSRQLALTLAAERAPGEPVFMLDKYYYDVPFYAGLRAPVTVVGDWTSADVGSRDNWRKELADAARFSTGADAVLIAPSSVVEAVCRARVSWLIGPPSAAAAYPFLVDARVAYGALDAVLWKVDANEPARVTSCEGRPSVGSADR